MYIQVIKLTIVYFLSNIFRLFVLRFAPNYSSYTHIIVHGYVICCRLFFSLYILHKNIKNNKGQHISYNSLPCRTSLYTVAHCTYNVHIYL